MPEPTSHLDERPPAARTIGKEILSVDVDSGDVRLRFLARPEFANRHGSVGGGFLAAMIDSTTAAPLLAKLPPELTAFTTELHVAFVSRASTGELYGSGRLVSHVDRDAEAEAEISMLDGTVVARGTAKFRIVARR